jgi:hypothetical protein
MIDDLKDDKIQVRLSKLEKKVIKDKAELLNLTVADYVRECCIFNNVTDMFMKKLHASNGTSK